MQFLSELFSDIDPGVRVYLEHTFKYLDLQLKKNNKTNEG